MNRQNRRAASKFLRKESLVYGVQFQQIPRADWPDVRTPPNLWKVWRNNQFLVQVYQEADQIIRLTVNRTAAARDGWRQEISWDDLQAVKNAVGFGNSQAVEIYPAEVDVVNVANMRHLWVLPEKLPFGWNA